MITNKNHREIFPEGTLHTPFQGATHGAGPGAELLALVAPRGDLDRQRPPGQHVHDGEGAATSGTTAFPNVVERGRENGDGFHEVFGEIRVFVDVNRFDVGEVEFE